MEKNFDTIIIGAGPAGLQAALFLTRAQVKTLVIGKPEESDLAYGKRIGNIFGILGEPTGLSLLENSIEQMKRYGGELLREEVIDVEKKEDSLQVKTGTGKEFLSKTLIIANGAAPTMAGIEREEEFFGKGVHTCVACDGIFYKGKKVGIIGEGNHAAEEALELTAFTKDATIFSQKRPWKFSKYIKKSLKEKGIKLEKKKIVKVEGKKNVERAKTSDGKSLRIDGIFLALGITPSLTFAEKLGLPKKDGFIAIDQDSFTGVDGVYAAGGAAGGNPQIAKDTGEGCNAAIAIIKKLKGLEQYTDQT